MVRILLVCLALGSAWTSAAGAAVPPDVVTIELPAGDAAAGRQAFEDLKCHLCHQVVGEKRFRAPAAEARGPDLGVALRAQSSSDVAAAIIAPSHSMSVRTSDAVKRQLRNRDGSPMGDFSTRLTIRQLADLLAYLRSPAGHW